MYFGARLIQILTKNVNIFKQLSTNENDEEEEMQEIKRVNFFTSFSYHQQLKLIFSAPRVIRVNSRKE